MAKWCVDFAEEWAGHTLSDRAVAGLSRTPRHLFAETDLSTAYGLRETELPLLPEGQPVSQAMIVGVMADLVGAAPGQRILEVGTGSGYQAAVMVEMGAQVFSVEVRAAVAAEGHRRLARCGYADRVPLRFVDGRLGWPEEAPFDGIVATALFDAIPPAWVEQLDQDARLVVPVVDPERRGTPGAAVLQLLRKSVSGLDLEFQAPCAFVPAVGNVA